MPSISAVATASSRVRWIAAGVSVVLAATIGGLADPAPALAGVRSAPSAVATDKAPLEATDLRSAQLTARVRGQRVEVLSQRTEATTTWANPNGSLTSDESMGPVRVRKGDGWVPLDMDLVEVAGGWAPKASPSAVTFSAGGDGPAVKLAEDSKKVQLDWTRTLPAPVIAGARATYSLDSNTNLVLTALPDGFEQSLVLKSAPAVAPKIHLPLDLTGLSLKDAGEGFDFANTAGEVVFSTPKPLMWDAQRDEAGLPSNRRPVAADLVPSDADAQLDLSPSMAWLTDPTTVYPVTIDPTIASLPREGDTFIKDTETGAGLHVLDHSWGIGFTGASKMRAIVDFGTSAIVGAQVTSASLKLWNHVSFTCTAKPVFAYPVTGPWGGSTITWANQPTVNTTATYSATKSFSHGVVGSCANDYDTLDVTKMVAGWASGALTGSSSIELRASETDSTQRKYFCSMNLDNDNPPLSSCTTSAHFPTLSVTYNLAPNTPGTPTHTPGTSSNTATPGWTTTTTPTLKATVTDPDGGSVKGLFSVYLNGTGTPVIDKAAGSSVTSGGTSQYVVPAGKLVNGSRYVVRAYANDGTLTSKAWSTNYDNFVVDTGLPLTPTVTSTTSPENEWSDAVDAGGNLAFTATGTSTDTAKVQYSLDAATYASSVNATPSVAAPFTLAKPAVGKHTLYVRTIDKAGNPSAGKAYVFYYGTGVALAQPVKNHVTARRIPLQLTIDPTQVAVLGTHKYQYRRGAADTWHDVPLSNVTDAGGGTLSAWPTTTASTAVSYWDAATTLGGGGAIDVRAFFNGNSAATNPNTVTVDINGGTGGDATAGPGSVNLLTGELSLSDSDATLFGASIGRTYGSRSLTAGTDNGQTGAFGPQWALSGASEYTDATWQLVHKTSTTSLDVSDADGGVVAFTAATQADTWVPEPGAEDFTLTGNFTTGFSLKDLDGNTTTFAKPAPNGATPPPADTWPVASTTPTGAGATARYGYLTDPAGKLRLARIAAPNAGLTDTALQACANPATDLSQATSRGCRTLELVWSDPDGAGPTTDRVTSIKAWAWNPGNSAMTTTTETTYGYDSSGRLSTVTDPKPGLVAGGAALSTTYGYDTNNLLTTLTPPGDLPWTFAYATGTTVAGPAWDRTLPTSNGRMVTVSRATLTPGSATTTNGTATTAVVYGVPTTTTLGPIAVDQTATNTWSQNIAPVEGAAVFDVDAAAQPAGDFWAGDDATKRSWAKSSLTYMDVNGRETNHLGRDLLMDATVYNTDGNPIYQLTGGNRATALGLGSESTATLAELGLTGASTDARAQALATITTYQDGTNGAQRVAWTQGPLHTVQTAAGTQDQQRATTRNTYNSGRPAGAPTSDLATSAVTGGLPLEADPGTAALDNPRTTTTVYDWTLGQPTAVTIDPSATAGDEIVTRTTYDTKGRVTQQQQPSDAAGTSAGSRVTTYWDNNTGTCTGHPEWGDLLCQTSYANAITGSATNTALPTTTTTYNRTGTPAGTIETANGATRTTTTAFDAADRPSTVTTTATGLGTAPAVQTMTYDATTGALTSTLAGGKAITTTTDQLGRQLTYTDGTELRSASEYDNLGRTTKTTESDTATGGLTRTFSTTTAYDTATARQTSQTDTQGGTASLGYDTAGSVTSVTQGAPSAGGLKATSRFDTTGTEVERVWTMTGLPDPVLSESAIENIHGQQVDHTMMPGGHRDYRYDNTGRLTSVTDLDAGACTTRAYRFDANSNRTGYNTSSAAATADGSGDLTICPAPATPSATATFDTGDRLTTTGHSYDAFGRTTRLPLPGGQVMRVGYHANDLVASQSLFATTADADANSGAGQNPIDTSEYTLDVAGQRIATRTAQVTDPDTQVVSTKARTLRYAGSSDSPDWTDEGDGTITRNITSPAGDLGATAVIDKTGTAPDSLVWQISDMHGDITATLPADNNAAIQVSRPDEYGAGSGDAPRYGWLGAKQRAGDTPAGIILMGVRLYNPDTGRFLSTDPVYGGNANTYSYPSDPINAFDLDGRWGWARRAWHVGRAFRNAPFSVAGYGYARASGARCRRTYGLTMACTGGKRFARYGGMTIGNVWVTRDRWQDTNENLRRHERRHSSQWAIWGANFPSHYAAASVASAAMYKVRRRKGCSNRWACYNAFEMNANLRWGRYVR